MFVNKGKGLTNLYSTTRITADTNKLPKTARHFTNLALPQKKKQQQKQNKTNQGTSSIGVKISFW